MTDVDHEIAVAMGKVARNLREHRRLERFRAQLEDLDLSVSDIVAGALSGVDDDELTEDDLRAIDSVREALENGSLADQIDAVERVKGLFR